MSAQEHLSSQQFRTVYHGVENPENMDSIQREGLRPGRLPEVYSTPDMHTAQQFAGEHVVEARVRHEDVIVDSPRSVTTRHIPPEQFVKVHTRDDTWAPALNREVPVPDIVRRAAERFKAQHG